MITLLVLGVAYGAVAGVSLIAHADYSRQLTYR